MITKIRFRGGNASSTEAFVVKEKTGVDLGSGRWPVKAIRAAPVNKAYFIETWDEQRVTVFEPYYIVERLL